MDSQTDARAWGIEPGYHDVTGVWHDTTPEAEAAVLVAMEADGEGPPAPTSWIVRREEPVRLPDGAWELSCEDGSGGRYEGTLPDDVPLGYHHLRGADREIRLVVTPGRCHLPADLRQWGWAAQLYATRSSRSWGIGDLADLRTLTSWTAEHNGGFVLVNPLHAALPGTPRETSPYSPSSRVFRDPIYLAVEKIPGASPRPEIADLAARARRLLDDRSIDRDEVHRLKSAALELLWEDFAGDAAFDEFLRAGGESLHAFATFSALSEVHGRGWQSWPQELRHPTSPAVARFAEERLERVLFHAWQQWLVDEQLRAAGAAVGVVQDVAIGAHPDGADTWMWQDVYAKGDVRVGAPPDEFNVSGQDWGLPPFDPWKLRASGYEPFVATLRAGFRHAGGLRFDHVMGLFRLYWIPADLGATGGAYVRYPAGDLLGLLALESHRAGAWVVGEDLGTVTDEARHGLAEADVLSYRLAWFEPTPPSQFPERALAAVTTHDLPTVAGLWTGADLIRQEKLGIEPNVEATKEMRARVAGFAEVPDDASADVVADKLHALLAASPSMLVAATLDDALGVEERPNQPGLVVPENWSMALPVPLDELVAGDRLDHTAEILSGGRRPPS